MVPMLAQNQKLNSFYAKYKHQPNTMAITLPGWLVKFGLSVSGEQAEMKKYKPLMRGFHSLRVLIMEEKNYASPEEVKALVKHAKEHRFKDLVAIKEGKDRVNILLREKKTKKKEIIKNIMILVSEEDELVLVTLNGRWKKSLLQKQLKELMKEDGGHFMDSVVKL